MIKISSAEKIAVATKIGELFAHHFFKEAMASTRTLGKPILKGKQL